MAISLNVPAEKSAKTVTNLRLVNFHDFALSGVVGATGVMSAVRQVSRRSTFKSRLLQQTRPRTKVCAAKPQTVFHSCRCPAGKRSEILLTTRKSVFTDTFSGRFAAIFTNNEHYALGTIKADVGQGPADYCLSNTTSLPTRSVQTHS